jgi:hypothetical protein
MGQHSRSVSLDGVCYNMPSFGKYATYGEIGANGCTTIFLPSDSMGCIFLADAVAQRVNVSVTTHGLFFTASDATFTYHGARAVTALALALGRLDGCFVVTITGTGLVQLDCASGLVKLRQTMVATDMIPVPDAGTISATEGSNEGSTFNSSGREARFVHMFSLRLSVGATASPTSGDTLSLLHHVMEAEAQPNPNALYAARYFGASAAANSVSDTPRVCATG